MRKAKRSLEIVDGLIWISADLVGAYGSPVTQPLVPYTGTATTILSMDIARGLGLKKSRKSELYDAPQAPVKTHRVMLPSLTVLGLQKENCWVGCQVFQSRLHVPGILGLDFFLQTDLRLAFLENRIYLSW